MKIIIADDHPIILSGVRALIESNNNDCQIVAEATDVQELFNQLKEHTNVDVLITDYSMPLSDYTDGIDMIKKIQRLYPFLKIIVFTQMANPGLLSTLVELNINGLLLKKDMLSDIDKVLTTIQSGKKYLSSSVKSLLVHKKNHSSIQLSTKELEVLRMFSNGMSVSEIAKNTNRSVKTISTQKKRAMIKLGLESNSEIYEYIKNSIILKSLFLCNCKIKNL